MLLVDLMKSIHKAELDLVTEGVLLFYFEVLHLESIGSEPEGLYEFDGAAMKAAFLGNANFLSEFNVVFLHALTGAEVHYLLVHIPQLK